MATPGRTPFVQVPHEILLALRLFGRLNGTEWEVVATVMDHSWGHRDGWREEAVLGMADFRAESLKTPVAIQKALARLGKGNAKTEAFRVLRVVAPPTSRSPTTWALQRDWEVWGWESPEHLEHARCVIRQRFRTPAAAEAPISGLAFGLAQHLRMLAESGNPGADLPPEDERDPGWRAWCSAMQSLLDRTSDPKSPTHSPDAIRIVFTHAYTDAFWNQRLRGRNTADRAVQHYDTLLALAQQASRRR